MHINIKIIDKIFYASFFCVLGSQKSVVNFTLALNLSLD